MADEAETQTQEEVMAARGYLTLQAAADKVRVDKSTMARWVRSDKVVGLTVGGRTYVERDSLIDYLGDDAAQELGL